MSLHNKDLAKKENNLMKWRRKMASKLLPDSKTQEEKKIEEMSLINALNLGNTGLAAGRFPPPPPLLLDTPEIEPRGLTVPPLYDEGMIYPLT